MRIKFYHTFYNISAILRRPTFLKEYGYLTKITTTASHCFIGNQTHNFSGDMYW